MKKKIMKIALIAVVSIVLLVICLLALVKVGERLLFTSFYSNATTEFKTPGIADGFIQQGFDYVESEDVFLVSGYMKDGSSSRVYVVDREDEKVIGFTKLRNQTGGRNTTHAGGIAHSGDYVYVTSEDSGVQVFMLSDILGCDEAVCKGTVNVGVKPAFCYIHEGKMYTGTFYKADTDYDSDKYIMKTLNGDENTAIMTVHDVDPAKKESFGIDETTNIAYSIPSQVQGICITKDNKIVLSTSWGISKSKLYVYDFDKVNNDATSQIDFFGGKTTLYYIDSESLEDTITAPPMAEEMVYLDGKIYIMNESASAKYIFGKFTSGNYVHAYKFD